MSDTSTARKLQHSSAGIAIDLMRGLLAIMVLVAHAMESAADRPGASGMVTSHPWLHSTLFQGGFWVNGFFILSGFCVHRSIMGMRRREGAFFKPYALARVTRIYPMYAIALLLATVFASLLGPYESQEASRPAGMIMGHVLMLQGVTGSFHELKPAWSLTYEAVYYLVWPLVLVACGWKAVRALLTAALGTLAVAALVMLGWRLGAGGAGDSMLIPLWLIPSQFLLWIGGAWLAEKWDAVIPHARSWWGAFAVVGILACYLSQAWLLQHEARQWMLLATGYATVPFWLALIAASHGWQNAAAWSRPAYVLGLLSYPLYILHQVFLDAAVRVVPSTGAFWTDAFLLGAMVLALVLVLGVPLESGILRWRSAWLARRKPLPGPNAMPQSVQS